MCRHGIDMVLDMCVDVLMDNVYRNACRHVCRHETASQTRAHICSVVGTEGLLAFAILERCADAYVDMRIHMCIHVCIDMCADRVGRLWTHAKHILWKGGGNQPRFSTAGRTAVSSCNCRPIAPLKQIYACLSPRFSRV